MKITRHPWTLRGFVALAALLALAACQPKVYLMPTPEALRGGNHDPFATAHDTRVVVAYATNRLPVGTRDRRGYLTLFDRNLRLGFATLRIGEEGFSWDELHRLSTSAQRNASIPIELEAAREVAVVDTQDSGPLSPQQLGFFATLNEALARSDDKDLLVYVHGANNSFYRASAQAAQLRHFTGRNLVVLAFGWPSAESVLRYAVDVNNARRTAPAFARLLELLAKYTNARHIDVLGYSAGAQVLSPALALLRAKYIDEPVGRVKRRLRLGEVYFAAPDTDFRQFVHDLAGYVRIPEHVTVTVNPNDIVLALAAGHHGVSRVGKPDIEELTAEETRWVQDASRKLPLDVIWVTSQEIPDLGLGSHTYWYDNPWVSTDVLLQMLFHARPAERGLVVDEEEGTSRTWYFPPDYPARVNEAIERLLEKNGLANPRR